VKVAKKLDVGCGPEWGGSRFGTTLPGFMEDPQMVLMLVTALVAGVAIFLAASLLGWILKKVAPKAMAGLSPVATTVAIVAVTTAACVYVMTRPAIVGPYEQWTFENIGGQVLGGVLAAGTKILAGRKAES
jgi:hypothetical protein